MSGAGGCSSTRTGACGIGLPQQGPTARPGTRTSTDPQHPSRIETAASTLISKEGSGPLHSAMLPSVDEIVANFELLDDWEERYRYLIELGRMLDPLPAEAHTDANKVKGCASQVWIDMRLDRSRGKPALHLLGD